MTVFTEGRHAGEAVLSEANFHRSRDNIVIASGAGIVEAGTVLGAVTADGKYAPSADASVVGFEGAEVAVAVNIHRVDATSADVAVAAITRDAELVGAALVYDASVDDAAKVTAKAEQLAAVGLIVR